MRSNHDFRALLQRQFNGRQRCTDTCVAGYFPVFNWYVQIRTDKKRVYQPDPDRSS
ncbi:hypothetical protein [Klebsiella pneumoniae IS39]|nr:hypothetical protein [Klebsiella pneumoniae ISC21]CDL60502.1 hypothetical protein [Klebsiella pneumoniae IS39]